MGRAAWMVAAIVLLVTAVTCLGFAFTRFSHGDPPQAGTPEGEAWQTRQMQQARASVLFGLAGCFTLLGAAASLQRARATGDERGADGPHG